MSIYIELCSAVKTNLDTSNYMLKLPFKLEARNIHPTFTAHGRPRLGPSGSWQVPNSRPLAAV